jgi:hypothetical protein
MRPLSRTDRHGRMHAHAYRRMDAHAHVRRRPRPLGHPHAVTRLES